MSQQLQTLHSNEPSSSSPYSSPTSLPSSSSTTISSTTNSQQPPAALPQKRSAEDLSIGGDSIADLIRKAKASRTASGAKEIIQESADNNPSVEWPMDESLESVLTCPICAEYLHRPVSLLLIPIIEFELLIVF